jgi:leucyl-tRNA synthetase
MMTLQRTLSSGAASVSPEDLREGVDVLLQTLAPIAPYVTEELWERLGGEGSIHERPWPEADANLAAVERVNMVVQVDAKVRGTIEVPPDISEDDAIAAAKALPRITELTAGREIARIIARPPNLVNFVLKK